MRRWSRGVYLAGGLAIVIAAASRSMAAAGSGAGSAAPLDRSPAAAPAREESSPVTLQLSETPLRTALQSLFSGTGLQYAVEPGVPNLPITLSVHDLPFSTALRALLRLVPGSVYRKESEIYVIGMRSPTPSVSPDAGAAPPPPDEPVLIGDDQVEKIPINFLHPAVVAYILNGQLVPTEDQLFFGAGGGFGGGYGAPGGGPLGSASGGGLGPAGLAPGYGTGIPGGYNAGYGVNGGGIVGPGVGYGNGVYGGNGSLVPGLGVPIVQGANNSVVVGPQPRRF